MYQPPLAVSAAGTTTGAATLADFLRDRLAEDEAAAARALTYLAGVEAEGDGSPGEDLVRYLERMNPWRILADVEVKRQIAAKWMWLVAINDEAAPTVEWVVQQIALPYAGHADYRDEWRP